MIELTIASINCRGLSDIKKRRDVFHFLRNQKYDVLFLQDTHITKDSTQYFNSLWKGKSYHSCHTNRSRGVSILINQRLQHELIEIKLSDDGNFIIVVCKLGTQTYLMANVYGPNEDDPHFYQSLINILNSFETDHTIIGGDFNFVINPNIDSLNYVREYNTNAKRTFMSFTNENALVDIWRVKNPNKLEYTWFKNNPFKCGRLDMLFVNAHLVSSVREAAIKPGYRTDHCFVALTLQIAEIEKGPGIWKFNESMLRESEYINLVNTTIQSTVSQYAVPVYSNEYVNDSFNYSTLQFTISDILFYETLLMLIRGETVQYCKRKARSKRNIERELQNNVQRAHESFNNDKCNAKCTSPASGNEQTRRT